uniref:Nardilysin-like n=1 Tax=Hirondellea gigas TaxID=1518452 RepID=A0A2P2I0K1_9CRUS
MLFQHLINLARLANTSLYVRTSTSLYHFRIEFKPKVNSDGNRIYSSFVRETVATNIKSYCCRRISGAIIVQLPVSTREEQQSTHRMTGAKINSGSGNKNSSVIAGKIDDAGAARGADGTGSVDAIPVELLPTPVKGLSDRKEYRSLRLSNGLRVLLVSDRVRHGEASAAAELEQQDDAEEGEAEGASGSEEEEEGEESEGEEEEGEEGVPASRGSGNSEYKAAASLAISWGSCESPPELPGLMHFLEHMVFMGSEKYPAENSFDDFITRHGGSDNAYTDSEHTNFHLNVHEAYLWEALDRFSQFFVSPLMKKNAMERERNAVDSEFIMALPSDSNREQQLLISLVPEGHPASIFTWGNAASLSALPDDHVHKRLHQLREKLYSAQYMTLAVQSRHTLDAMQQQVARIFSQIPNNGLEAHDYSHLPFAFPASSFNKLIKMEAMKAKHTLAVTWFLPPMLKDYRRQPLRLLSNLIGHEGHGSLLSYYMHRNWSCGLVAESEEGDFDHGSFCSQLRVVIDLTEEGFKNVDQILLALFQYTSLLRTQPPTLEMFQEFQKLAKLNIDFEVESEPMENVEKLSACMLYYTSEDYLTGANLMFDFDPQFMQEISERLTPDTANIVLRSRLLGDFTGQDTKTEKWFGTKYTIEEISEEWRQLFSTAETCKNPSLHLPHPNPFIPTDFSLLHVPSPLTSAPQVPKIVVSHPTKGNLFYKPDYKFELPVVHVKIQFELQKLPERETVRFLNVVSTLLQCYRYHLLESIYDALLAKCSYSITYSTDSGIVLSLGGFSQTVQELLILLLDYLANFRKNFSEKQFEMLKDLETRKLYNSVCKPNNIRNFFRLHLLLPKYPHPLELLQLMGTVTTADVLSLSQNLLNNARVNMLVQGNIGEKEAIALYNIMQSHVLRTVSEEDPVQLLPMPGYHVLSEGVTVMRVGTTNLADGNSAISNYYQGEPGTLRSQLLLDFLSSAIEEQCFDTLRTQEQLSYSVYSQANESNGVCGFSIHITPQAEKFSVHHTDTRIEAFLSCFLKRLSEMTADSFETLKETVLKMKKIDDLALDEEIYRNWGEILRREFLFDRLHRQIELLDGITKAELIAFYNSLVDPQLSGYRKLSVQVVGSAHHKAHNPPPIQQLLDGGNSCLEFQSCPASESPTPATCKSPPMFVQQCQDYISTLTEKPPHQITQ